MACSNDSASCASEFTLASESTPVSAPMAIGELVRQVQDPMPRAGRVLSELRANFAEDLQATQNVFSTGSYDLQIVRSPPQSGVVLVAQGHTCLSNQLYRVEQSCKDSVVAIPKASIPPCAPAARFHLGNSTKFLSVFERDHGWVLADVTVFCHLLYSDDQAKFNVKFFFWSNAPRASWLRTSNMISDCTTVESEERHGATEESSPNSREVAIGHALKRGFAMVNSWRALPNF
ncbi:hypothetical protein DL93DRAFT_2204378 [Clavulina sp. PMI_390]|nr:hypothetical protein DL93DRAFT_2204378 [Clavulina sp. PMI_390]